MTNPFAGPPQQQPQADPWGQPQQQQQAPANPFAPPPQPTPQPSAPMPPEQGAWPPPQQPQQPAAGQPQGGDEFGQPARGGGGDVIKKDDWRSYIGNLILFEVTELHTGMTTKNTKPGETTSAILATVTVIDHVGEPRVHEDAFVFPPVLVTACKKTALAGGGRVLGRLIAHKTQGGRETVALADHTPQDGDVASRYLRWRDQQSMQQPTAPAQQQQQEPSF